VVSYIQVNPTDGNFKADVDMIAVLVFSLLGLSMDNIHENLAYPYPYP